jgi:hypothetical protein
MKAERRPLMAMTKSLLTTAAFFLGVLSLSGCVTNKVLDLRRDRETRVKEAAKFWPLAAVRSAQFTPDGETFACVDFRDSPTAAPQTYTIDLTRASKIGRPYQDLRSAGADWSKTADGPEKPADLIWHLYPLQEAQKGCVDAAGDSSSTVSALRAEALQIRREDQSRLPAILISSESDAADEWRIIEVSFSSKDQAGEPAGARDVMLVYVPPSKSAEAVQATGIAGAFEPDSEWINPYTLLVAPAVAADTVIIFMFILLAGSAYR